MDELRGMVPLVRDIMSPPRAVSSSMKVSAVVDLFRDEPSLRVLPLIDDDTFVGSVSRKNLFFRHLNRKYAADLFSNKPIAVLCDEQPVLMEPQLDITDALARLLESDPQLETDCFLIVDETRCLGVVAVSDLMMKISESQRRLLDTLRDMSARIREEVAHAGRIQQDLLPAPWFRFEGISVAAGLTTSTEIGGDFYDYFPCGETRLGLIIADVSGHGVQSGMVTTAAKASLHTLLAAGITTPEELLAGMNRAIIATARRRLLVTCFIAVIDTATASLSYANAGHNFPYLHRGTSGELSMLQHATGFPLGFEEEAEFPQCTTGVEPGDSLVLYTDGIVECRSEEGDEFGYERMESMIGTSVGRGPDELVHALLVGARNFSGAGALEDDATVLVASFIP